MDVLISVPMWAICLAVWLFGFLVGAASTTIVITREADKERE